MRIIFLFLLVPCLVFSQKEINKINYKDSKVTIDYLLQKYIQIPSESNQERAAGEFLKSICRNNGLHITDFGTENGNFNFAASLFPLSIHKPNIIFLNHIDVVPENDDSLYGPYSGKIVDGNIYGRGAIDNKGVAIMQLYSILEYLKNSSFNEAPFNITFLSVSCEETQCEGGAQYVVDNYLDILNPAVVIGEGPSELTSLIKGHFNNPVFGISVVHKRTFWLNLDLEIHANGHASITPLEYANKEMIKALDRLIHKKRPIIFTETNTEFLKSLSEQTNGMKKLVLKNPRLFKPFLKSEFKKHPELKSLFTNTITLTNIYTNSHSYNKIPSKISAYLDCRLLPLEDENKFLHSIKKSLNNDSIKITIVENMPKIAPSKTDNIFYKNLNKAIFSKYSNSKTIPVLLPNINDLWRFREKGIPAYACIPVYFSREQVENIHNTNENIPISSLYDGAEVYLNFLNNMNNTQ